MLINLDNNDDFIQNYHTLDLKMESLLKISENILECTTVNRLFYYLCEFFCELADCPIAQGIIIIGNEYYLISEFNVSIRQFKLLDYIPLIKVNDDFKTIYDALNTEFKKSHNYVDYETLVIKYSLPKVSSFENKVFFPLYYKNTLYGFILLNNKIIKHFNDTMLLNFIDLILLQASAALKRICKNDLNLYLNNTLNINHPLLNSKIKEQESFTCLTSLDGYIIKCSEGSLNVLQYLNTNLLTTSIFEYIHPLHKEIFVNEYKNMLSSKKPYSSRILMINSNKTYTWVKFTCKYSYDENNMMDGICFYIANHDYSDDEILKELNISLYKNSTNENEELKKNIAEKTELLNNAIKYDKRRCDFFANISHELRTPVNVIYSALQLLNIELPKYLSDFDDSCINKRVKTMKQNCYRLIKLINNLVDTSKIESGYYQLFLGKYNIVSLIEDITLSVAEYVEDKGINLIFDTNIEEKLTYCDAEKIERIILNLISNAIKFTEKNGEIKVSLEDKESYLLVSVSDTGTGIPVDKCNSIFQRFVQVDCNRKGEKEGSGIGLNLVRSLIEMHKGEIWVESVVGKGSIFTFKLPYCYNPESVSSNIITNTSFLEKDKVQTIEIEFSDIYL